MKDDQSNLLVNHEGIWNSIRTVGGRQEANSQTGTQQNHRESMNQTVGNPNSRRREGEWRF